MNNNEYNTNGFLYAIRTHNNTTWHRHVLPGSSSTTNKESFAQMSHFGIGFNG